MTCRLGPVPVFVLMFVIWLELVPLADGKDTTGRLGRRAPFVEIAGVTGLSPEIGSEVTRTYLDGPPG